METRADRTAGVYEVAESDDIINRHPFRPGIAVASQIRDLRPSVGCVAFQHLCLLQTAAYKPIIVSRHDTGVEFRGGLRFAVARPSPGLNGDEQFARAIARVLVRSVKRGQIYVLPRNKYVLDADLGIVGEGTVGVIGSHANAFACVTLGEGRLAGEGSGGCRKN